ncbi:DUF4257 domain-containing protein [Bacillus sp. SM2101]|uniref:DUF4257 domain-containing protein n=1 Tax=Bacillus sp. SM2101 TaxID=2805366 RepID=UPI001BDEF0D3|nr:DUF4257 domain-containing protein [Bacillus sp. SM2101]
MLLNLVIAVFTGCFMGVLMHTKKHGKVKKPKNTKLAYHPGVLEEMLWGAVAASLLVIISEPSDWWRAVFLGIIGGYGGEGVVLQFDYQKATKKLENVKKNQAQLNMDLEDDENIN